MPREPIARRPTMADVAAAAGVSTALVSIVMRDVPGASAATRERVLAAAAELGYRPDSRARLLRSSNSRLLGVVFHVQQDFHGSLLTGLYAAAAAVDHQITLSAVTPGRDERAAVNDLLQDRCEAVILLGPESPRAFLAEIGARTPVVALTRNVRHRLVDVVRTADDQGLHQAVDHLVQLGHRRIVHVEGGRSAGAAERRRGYTEAMRRHGLDAEARIVPGGADEDDGAAAARLLLAGGLPTAVTVFNDRCATGLLEVLRTSGVDVPGDVSVVGFDDSRLARLSFVDLTTVAQDVPLLSRLTVERAIARAQGETVVGREQVIPPRLVVRQTSGPVRVG
ncbi:LacI family DNA-binding transcriptional regulator [Nakamurella deserti]|uniref:LacI family DNA-binding transcriptional regulator n=1 Tax=Nakamurella deserti TaxID=2164074 RepID=UPI00197C2672|nr:LacI family DNA-binding transcriptional regulator [Nakamurella deserti]